MARYTADSKERVREAVDMVDLVSAYTELRKAGPNRYEGRCPFHDERTPSFGIDPIEKLYHCFGCGVGGDVFHFVQEKEGLDFRGALEFLGDRYGVELELEAEDPRAAEARRREGRLYELLERAAAFYARNLWEAEEAAPAREYLAARGLEEATLREFRVGYAPSAYDRLLLASRRAGFSNQETWDAGLVQRARGEGRLYDRFRRRIVFPLCDLRGRVLGFGARAIGPDQMPKYLNSADNVIYHKGRHVFGADVARAAAAKAGSVIVAEGYTDVIALHQAGLRNTVGLMGTALTADQVGELARLAPVVRLALDADSAGHEAIVRAARVAEGRRLELRVVPLPDGKDPADLVAAEGADAVRALVEASVPFVRFQVERELARADLRNPEGKDRAIGALRPVFATLAPSALREELIRLVAGRTDLAPSLAAKWLAQQPGPDLPRGDTPADGRAGGASRGGEAGGGPGPRTPVTMDAAGRRERAFLAQCIALPSAGGEALAAVDIDRAFTSDLHRRAAKHLLKHVSAPASGLPERDDALATLIAELTLRARTQEGSPAALEAERLKLELGQVERDIASARASGTGDVAALATRRSALKAAVDEAIDRVMGEAPIAT